jgi:phage-related minor tail protein
MAINFANEEKRANAQQIISDSYGAAMKAYKALAGIPVVGPALGAAAAGTIITAGAAYATQSLAGRATGGQVRGGQSYLVGERGPELLTMGGSGRISSNDQLKQAVGGGGGITVINNVDARGADASVDQKIRLAMKQTSESTTRNIQNLMKRRRFV